MNIKACLSSASVEWATPSAFFQELDKEFHFNLDPCCTHSNAKCQRHFTKEDNGLIQDWGGQPYLLIRRMERKLKPGYKRPTTKAGSLVLLSLCLSRPERIPDISTTIYTTVPKSALSVAAFTLTTARSRRRSLLWS